MTYDKRHGGPYDRGSADAYYRRPYDPHYYIMNNNMFSERVTDLTEEQLQAYAAGFNEETERKEW